MIENKFLALPTNLKSLIDYQIIRGELPRLFNKKALLGYNWNKIEKLAMANIDAEKATTNKQSNFPLLGIYISLLSDLKINKNILIMYEQNESVRVDLAEISFPLSHPTFNYKSLSSHFNLKRLPLLLVNKDGVRYRVNESVGKVTFSGNKTFVLPLF